LTRGPKPLLFVTLPEMPFWKDYVPLSAEPVEKVGSNLLRSTIVEGRFRGVNSEKKRLRRSLARY